MEALSTNKKLNKRLQASVCVYTSCYCEENVWKMCDQIKRSNPEDISEYYVVFISNSNNQIPLWMQKQSAEGPLTPVVWDYHVVLVQKSSTDNKVLVYDLDSIMAFPCPLELYLIQAIQSEKSLKKDYHRKFRIIPALTFLATFASDRSHMLLSNGQYMKPPPEYPPIRTADEVMTLDDFISMSPKTGEGCVKDLAGFAKYFQVAPPP